jgi:sterol desaturase/sphingolipid hydroxylase (fatty acid hydroxylase superfamily)
VQGSLDTHGAIPPRSRCLDTLAAVQRSFEQWRLVAFSEATRFNIGLPLAFVGAAVIFEAMTGRNPRRYFSKNARTDAVYLLFYAGGIYAVFVSQPFTSLLHRLAQPFGSGLSMQLLQRPFLPATLRIVLGTMLVDLIGYWLHRWMHSSPTLWAFHSIHHSQESLTLLTNFRAHVGDVAVQTTVFFLVGMVLSPPPAPWAVVGLLQMVVALLAHSGFTWSYGLLDRLIVSPRHHSFHHSADPQHYDTNLGMLFSLWDYLFGTVARDVRLPRRFGVPGLGVPESVVGQLVFPFRHLGRRWIPQQ